MDFHPIIVCPTFNNANTLPGILDQLGKLAIPILVVNDGSTDKTSELLSTWTGGQSLTHSQNRGKAAALQSGFARARELGFSHALTIDTDGQHDVKEIPSLLAAAQHQPNAIILGTRARNTDGYPARSRLGRSVSNLLVRMESGLRVTDSQCGLRVYPLAPLANVHCHSGRYGFETEILTRWAWAGFPVVQIPVACLYLPPERCVSHFQPWRDSFRAVGMHTRLAVTASLFALSPRRALRELRTRQGAGGLAAGLAMGAFIACLPFFGMQSIISLIAARLFKLNPLSVLAGSQLSFGPVAPFVIFLSTVLGHLLLHGSLPHADFWRTIEHPVFWRPFIVELFVGSLLLGVAAALLTYAIARAAFRLTRPA